MKLISDELNSRLDILVGGAFRINRVLDRSVSLLATRFKLLKTAEIVHEKLAHMFPVLGDMVSNFQMIRGMETIYPETVRGDKSYNNHIELFEDMREEFSLYQDAIEDCIDFSIAEKDHATKSFLQSYLSGYLKYIETIDNLVEISTRYGLDFLASQLFDDESYHCFTI